MGPLAMVLISAVLGIMWALTMFSDSWLGEFWRAWGTGMRAPKNLTSLTYPTAALLLFCGGMGALLEDHQLSGSLADILAILSLVLVVILVVSFFPVPLPTWMYPEWHLKRRQERAIREGRTPPSSGDRDMYAVGEENPLQKRRARENAGHDRARTHVFDPMPPQSRQKPGTSREQSDDSAATPVDDQEKDDQ